MKYDEIILKIGEDYAKHYLDDKDATLEALMDFDADYFMDVGSHSELSEHIKRRCLNLIKYVLANHGT